MSINMRLDTVVCINDDIPSVELGDEIALMNVESGKYFGLGTTGTSIWKLLQAPIALSNVAAKLLESYNVPQKTCEDHVLEFVSQLAEEDLVKVC